MHASDHWLALVIGNSRCHWAWFVDDRLQAAWDTSHLSASMVDQLIRNQCDFSRVADIQSFTEVPLWDQLPPLWLASVVPDQTALWHPYEALHPIALSQVPLENTYPTLGIDRAIAAWGAVTTLSSPVLVIDGGTALTLTGVDRPQRLIGGAILPGLQLQFRALGQATAALPVLSSQTMDSLPSRWATNTPEAIQSGIVYTVLAGIGEFIGDWLRQFPESAIVLTGGDGAWLCEALRQQVPELGERVTIDPHLMFWGMQTIRARSAH